ncbi:MAG: hypothetical protein WC547_06580 [Candidatus Omnitrophota bacterium]
MKRIYLLISIIFMLCVPCYNSVDIAQAMDRAAEQERQDAIDHRLKQLKLMKERYQYEVDNTRDEFYRSIWQQRLNEVKYEERKLRDLQK